MYKNSLILVGRIVDGTRLIGGKFFKVKDKTYININKKHFISAFKQYNILNCTYKNNKLQSSINTISLKKLNKYSSDGRLLHIGYHEDKLIDYILSIYNKSDLLSGGRILDPDSKKAEKFAERYYGQIRSMSNDISRISKNTGINIEIIKKIKQYSFIDTHTFLDGTTHRFIPDCAIAQSWQRLAGYTNEQIQPHDLVLLKHELLEMKLVNQGMPQEEAHIIASEKYNYSKESAVYYKNLRKENKNV